MRKYLVMSKKSSTFALAFEKKHGPLAQLNRVPHYGCGGCRFESCTDHKQNEKITQELILWRDFFVLFVRHRVEGRWITKKSYARITKKRPLNGGLFCCWLWGGLRCPIGLSDSGNQKSGDNPIIFRVGGHTEKASCVLSRRSPVRSQVRIWWE